MLAVACSAADRRLQPSCPTSAQGQRTTGAAGLHRFGHRARLSSIHCTSSIRRGRSDKRSAAGPAIPTDVLGQELFAQTVLRGKVLDGALFSSGKPVLVIPEGATASLRPKRVMIAWDSRLEASNAVSRAMDLLKTAHDVHVVLVDPVKGESEQGAEPGADIATYLARHGVKVTVDQLSSQGGSIVDTLRQQAVDMAADMMVMGAYTEAAERTAGDEIDDRNASTADSWPADSLQQGCDQGPPGFAPPAAHR